MSATMMVTTSVLPDTLLFRNIGRGRLGGGIFLPFGLSIAVQYFIFHRVIAVLLHISCKGIVFILPFPENISLLIVFFHVTFPFSLSPVGNCLQLPVRKPAFPLACFQSKLKTAFLF